MFVRTVVPAALLAAYAVAWAWAAVGRGVPGGDDHPGQVYRLIHIISLGPAPWHWNPGWWAGYPEMQYYPPGFFYLGYLVHWLLLGLASPGFVYLLLVWLVLLLPAATTYALLARVLGSGWPALPGAFLAFAISAGTRSGMEEGVRWGLVAARLGWGLLPLLALSLLPWLEGPRRPRAAPALLLAAVVLAHPAHASTAMAFIVVAALVAEGPRVRRLATALVVLAVGLGVAALWLIPLVAHLVIAPPMALALTWGDSSLPGLAAAVASRPLLLLLLAVSVAGWVALVAGLRPPRTLTWLQVVALSALGLTVADALLAERTGLLWLPADRVIDGAILALILGVTAATAALVRAGIARYRWDPPWAAAGIAITLGIAAGMFLSGAPVGSQEPTVSLWPRPGGWPTADEIIRGNRLNLLWDVLRRAPSGRVLFLRSGVPLEFGRDWWRAHSHVTGLTPVVSDRDIIGGTFTHPSPVAGYYYAGLLADRDARRTPIRQLAEQYDGVSVFGRALGRQRPGEFTRLAIRLRVSAVVALEEDAPGLTFLITDPEWGFPTRVGPFLVFTTATPRPLPQRLGPDRYFTFLAQPEAGWASTGVAWSPLWRARSPAGPLATRQGDLGLLEVEVPGARGVEVTLHHRPGVAEWAGALTSLAAAAVLLLGRGWLDRRLA
ncbi:MAG TPA: hypothetical protein VJU81_05625 [Methylomirabilota bacterium]|nr:hypothetical protein [Methylomirabilota bacterium]